MAATAILELETHPDGTVGVNAIVTGNWSRLEKVFGAVETLTPAASVNLDANEERSKSLAISQNTTFTTSNLAAGRHLVVRIIGDSVSRNFTFPGGWTFVGGAAPASIAGNKDAILRLWVWGATDAAVQAEYHVEP